MPRARTTDMQTAAATEEASGCFSFILPPLAVLFVSAVLASFAWNHTLAIQPADAPSQPANIQNADSPLLSPGISPIFTREIQYWGSSISQWAAASNLDPNLAAVVMQIESCGDPRATSRSGAMGLFQVMPFHFYATDSPYNPDTNAARGLNYLSRSLAKAGGDARLALAGYNGGIGVIARAEWTWPAQTKRYVQYGWPIYQDAQSGAATSAAVEEWYNKYGASLCRQARERLGLP